MSTVFAPPDEIIEPALSEEFYRLLQEYMGGRPEEVDEATRARYLEWWRDHAGRRCWLFQGDMIWRLERENPLTGRHVLDFGCGSGSSTAVFAQAGARVTALEPDALSLEMARQRIHDMGLEDRVTFVQIPYINSENSRLDLPDDSFDVVTMFGVLEHMKLDERHLCIAEIHRVTRIGGEVFVYDTPNRCCPYDYHTTNLWLVGWMPVWLARHYAIARKRFDRKWDFQRRGATGLSRSMIFKTFGEDWRMCYDRPLSEVLGYDVGALVRKLPPWLGGTSPRITKILDRVGFLAAHTSERIGIPATNWAINHTFAMQKIS